MADEYNNEVSEAVSNSVETVSSEHVTTSLTTYRQYGAFDEKGQVVGFKVVKQKQPDGTVKEVTEFTGNPAVMSETATHKNWEGAEKAGATVLNQNAFKFYALKDENGFATLVPDDSQRLYIIQKGLDAIQTAAANKLMSETAEKKDKEDPDEFVYNDQTIDLREAINRPPEKRNLTPIEKFERAASTLDQNSLAEMIAKLQAKLQAQAS